jgi:glycosyltransferase involved in cell wall biosynthesis
MADYSFKGVCSPPCAQYVGIQRVSIMNSGQTRVLIIHQALAPYRVDLFNRLAEHLEFQVAFLRPAIGYHKSLKQDRLRAELTISYTDLASNRVILERDLPIGLMKLIEESDADVVVTSEYSLASMMVAYGKRYHSRRPIGHVIWSEGNPVFFDNCTRFQREMRHFLARHADALIFYTEEGGDAFARHFGARRDKIFRCANHQEERRFLDSVSTGSRLAYREAEERGLTNAKLILYVGRLVGIKNVRGAIEAFAATYGGDVDVHFVIIGDGVELPALRLFASRLPAAPRIHFLGHREGALLHGWYSLASVFILASRIEPYGAVVNEALMAGVPVVCSTAAGSRALIKDNFNGFKVDPDNTGSISGALGRSARWLRSCRELFGSTRDSLMPLKFEDDVTGFLGAVNYAREQTRGKQ